MDENNSDIIGNLVNDNRNDKVTKPRVDFLYRPSWIKKAMIDEINHPGDEEY